MTRRSLTAICLVAVSATIPLHAVSVDRLLSDLEAAAVAGASSSADLLDAALGGAPPPLDCLSPVLLQAAQSGREVAAGPWMTAPVLPDARVWLGPAGVRIHYTVRSTARHAVPLSDGEDGERSPPRYVEVVGEAVASALDLLDAHGFRVSERHPWIDVHLARLAEGVSGYVAPSAAEPQEDRGGFLVLDTGLTDPTAAAIHQMAHLALLGYSHREPVWWHEASASWLSLRAAGGVSAQDAAALLARVSRPEAGLTSDDLQLMRGSVLFPLFLSLGEDAPVTVRRVWEACAALPGPNLLEALDGVARETGRGSLDDLLRAFYASWVAETAGRSALIRAAGMDLPAPGIAGDRGSYPATGALDRIAPLGAAYVHFRSQARPGGLDLSVEAGGGAAWDALLLVRSSPRAPFVPVPMAMDERDTATLRYPWGNVSDSLLVLVGLPGGDGDLLASYAARYRPSLPFDLIELGARSGPQGVRIQWSTDSEVDLFGWNVYRGLGPGRGFARINGVPIPAAGAESRAASYTFLDASPPQRKAYYYVEAITLDGFSQATHAIGARPVAR